MWTHEGPSKKMDTWRSNIQKEKNDEHLKAHVLKKGKEERYSCFKIISYRERSYLQKGV